MEFVKYEISTNPDQSCHCCNAPIKYVVTLSDGNKYGKDCARNLISPADNKTMNFEEKIYFSKNSPYFEVGIVYGKRVGEIRKIQARDEAQAIKIYHKTYNNNKGMSIFRGSRCLYRGKTMGTQYETTIDKFVIVNKS